MDDNITQSRQEKPQPQGGSFISLDEAAERTRRFREDFVQKAYDKEEKIKGNYFSKEQLLKVLNQPGCEGIRIYNSVRAKIDKDPETGERIDRRDLVIVAVDKTRDDILEVRPGGGCSPLGMFMVPASGTTEKALILGDPDPCPTLCGKPNGLNGS